MTDPSNQLSKTILLNIPPEILEGGGRLTSRRWKSGFGWRPDPRSIAAAAIESADLKVLFRNVYDAALIADMSGSILDANPRASVAFDYTVPEFCKRSIADIIAGFDDSVMSVVCDNLKKDQFTLIQAYCLRKDGAAFPAEISTSRIHVTSRDYLCFFIRDITTRKEAEEELRRAHDELAAQVEQRTRLNEELNAEIAMRVEMEGKLREAIVKLQEHDTAKSQFVSNVSHELKTPLTSIHYLSGNLLKGVAGEQNEKAQSYLQMIRTDCQRLARTVEDILDVSRMEAHAQKLHCVKIQFPRFVSKAVESLRIQVESAGLTFAVSIEGAGRFVNGDPQKLERVIFNIIRNAIKFNVPRGSVAVGLRLDPDAPGVFILDVTDSGIGIAPQHLARITERYFRVGEYVSGAGLGLSICKELIEQHGGVLEIQSPPSGMMRGARVAMRVPVAVPAVVLTMCDEDGLAGRIRRALESCGYKVVGARLEGDPEQALKDAKPDLVVLDWSAGGFEVAGLISAIKRNEAYRQIPLIVVTGGEPGSIKQEIIQGFGLAEVRQPWTDEELCVRLDQMILGRKDFIV